MKRVLISTVASLVFFGTLVGCNPATTGSSVSIRSVAAKNANGGYPVAFKIFALGSDHLFYGYDFYSLTAQPETVLGVTLRKVVDEVEVEPGQSVVFGPYELPPNTRNIGVIGTFQSGERAKWRDTVAVQQSALPQEVMVVIDRNAIFAVTPEEYNQSVTKAQQASKDAASAAAQQKAGQKKAQEQSAAAKKKKAEETSKKKQAQAQQLRLEAQKLEAQADQLVGQ